MPRMMLTDASWRRLSSLMLQSGRVYYKLTHRLTLEGILYRMRTGCPWRDLPSVFGDWAYGLPVFQPVVDARRITGTVL